MECLFSCRCTTSDRGSQQSVNYVSIVRVAQLFLTPITSTNLQENCLCRSSLHNIESFLQMLRASFIGMTAELIRCHANATFKWFGTVMKHTVSSITHCARLHSCVISVQPANWTGNPGPITLHSNGSLYRTNVRVVGPFREMSVGRV